MKTAAEIRAEIAALNASLAEAEAIELRASRRGNATKAIALLGAMKAARAELERIWPGLFEGDKWDAFNTPTAWPRVTSMKKTADLSETQVAEFIAQGESLIAALK